MATGWPGKAVMHDLHDLLMRCSHEHAIRRVLWLRQAVKSAAGFAACGLLAEVGDLPARTLALRGTPFVWHATQRYLAEPTRELANSLAVCCFDAYCSLLSADTVLNIRRCTLLPVLGVVAEENVQRSSAEVSDDVTDASLASTMPVKRFRGHVLRLACSGVGVISMPTADLFDAESNRYIVDNGAEDFAALVAEGLALIRSADNDIYRGVIEDVKWVVRVESPS